jgi:class 3 adenylate cyclase
MRSRIQTVRNFVRQHSPLFSSHGPSELGIIWLVVRVLDFEQLISTARLQDIASIMNQYYSIVADTVLVAGGDVNCLCGPTAVVHFGAIQMIDEATVVRTADAVLRNLRDSLEGLEIGLGLCSGPVICGRFGSDKRATHTAFGPPQVCAERQANRGPQLSVCELVAANIPSNQFPTDARFSVYPHWHEGKII